MPTHLCETTDIYITGKLSCQNFRNETIFQILFESSWKCSNQWRSLRIFSRPRNKRTLRKLDTQSSFLSFCEFFTVTRTTRLETFIWHFLNQIFLNWEMDREEKLKAAKERVRSNWIDILKSSCRISRN